MNTHVKHARSTYEAVIHQGRMWFRFARILDEVLRTQNARLWVKPILHAQYGLRQTARLRAHTFILTTRLEGGSEGLLQTLLQQERHAFEELHPRQTKDGRLALYTTTGHRLGLLGRPAWSWIGPLVEIRHMPRFFLYEIAACKGTLKAHVVISHFHEGARAYLMEHYRQRAEAALA